MNKNNEQILLDSILMFERDIIPKFENELNKVTNRDENYCLNVTESKVFHSEVRSLFVTPQRLFLNELLRNTFSYFNIFNKTSVEMHNLKSFASLLSYTEKLSIDSFLEVRSLSIDFYKNIYSGFIDLGLNLVLLKSQGFSIHLFSEEDFQLLENNLYIVFSEAYRKAILTTIRNKSALSLNILYLRNDNSFVKFEFNDVFNTFKFEKISEGSLSQYFEKFNSFKTIRSKETKEFSLYLFLTLIEKKVFLKNKNSDLFFSVKKDTSIFYIEKDPKNEMVFDFGYFSSDELKYIISLSRKNKPSLLGTSRTRDQDYDSFFSRMKFL